MTRNPALRPYRSARQALDLADSIRRCAYAVAAGFAGVMLLAVWWR